MGEINKRIKEIRSKKRFTQEDLAEKLGMKISTYSQMERTGKISCETLIEIARILKTDIRYFLYGEDFIKSQYQNKGTESAIEDDGRVLLDKDEEYIILTYRNLDNKNRQEAYHLFMENYNINTIIQKRREERQKKQSANYT